VPPAADRDVQPGGGPAARAPAGPHRHHAERGRAAAVHRPRGRRAGRAALPGAPRRRAEPLQPTIFCYRHKKGPGPRAAEWGSMSSIVGLSQGCGVHRPSRARLDASGRPRAPPARMRALREAKTAAGRSMPSSICLHWWLSRGLQLAVPRAVRSVELGRRGGAQDEGPVMVTEAEEVTDGLRTQARAAHQTPTLCRPGTVKPPPRPGPFACRNRDAQRRAAWPASAPRVGEAAALGPGAGAALSAARGSTVIPVPRRCCLRASTSRR